MSQSDQISTSIAVNSLLNRQQAKQAGLVQELATGTTRSSIATALATPQATQTSTLNVAQQNIAVANNVLSVSQQALTSVANNLNAALKTAYQALGSALGNTPSGKSDLAQQFNAEIGQTSSFTTNASVNGLNLVSANSQPMTVNTTGEGGKITINNSPSDATSLGVAPTGASGWSSTAAIKTSIDQVQAALNQISSTQASLGAAQSTLGVASEVNQSSLLAASQSQAAVSGVDIAGTAAAAKTAQTQSELAVASSAEQNKLAESVLKLLKE